MYTYIYIYTHTYTHIRRFPKMMVPPNHPSHQTILALKPMLPCGRTPDAADWASACAHAARVGKGLTQRLPGGRCYVLGSKMGEGGGCLDP